MDETISLNNFDRKYSIAIKGNRSREEPTRFNGGQREVGTFSEDRYRKFGSFFSMVTYRKMNSSMCKKVVRYWQRISRHFYMFFLWRCYIRPPVSMNMVKTEKMFERRSFHFLLTQLLSLHVHRCCFDTVANYRQHR